MLAVGSLLPLLNAFMCQRADASADGYSVFVKGPDHTFEQAVARMGSGGARAVRMPYGGCRRGAFRGTQLGPDENSGRGRLGPG